VVVSIPNTLEVAHSCWISRLKLQDFRGYSALSVDVEPGPLVLTGPNGAGKTNILEAISLLSPGRGLRRAKLEDIKRFSSSLHSWAVVVDLFVPLGEIRIGTGVESSLSEKRVVRVNGASQPQNSLLEWLSVIWQTPQMDRLFIEGASIRRKFLDHLVMGLDPEHARRLHKYEHALRERSRLLKDMKPDSSWVSILEETMARESVAIIASRQEFIKLLNDFCQEGLTTFPKARTQLEGDVERSLERNAALEVEENLQKKLFESRSRDAMMGGAEIGAHQSDFQIYHLDFDRPAGLCSTGEQKALLLSMMMANCRLQKSIRGVTPVLLLDEVVAHLDEQKREALFKEIRALGLQTWMTGTDRGVFSPLEGFAQFFHVLNASIHPQY
jgi:DNA replication and repair protein RecF